MRTIRDENALIRHELGGRASRDELQQVLKVLSDRIAGSEALLETRFDRFERRLDQTERSLNGRPERIERLLEHRG